jgi:hypothetical protein
MRAFLLACSCARVRVRGVRAGKSSAVVSFDEGSALLVQEIHTHIPQNKPAVSMGKKKGSVKKAEAPILPPKVLASYPLRLASCVLPLASCLLPHSSCLHLAPYGFCRASASTVPLPYHVPCLCLAPIFNPNVLACDMLNFYTCTNVCYSRKPCDVLEGVQEGGWRKGEGCQGTASGTSCLQFAFALSFSSLSSLDCFLLCSHLTSPLSG